MHSFLFALNKPGSELGLDSDIRRTTASPTEWPALLVINADVVVRSCYCQ